MQSSWLFLVFILHLLCYSLHRCLHLCLLVFLNDCLELIALLLYILFISGTHALVHLIAQPVHSALPDLLTIVSDVACLVAGLADFLCELDQVIQCFVLIVDVIPKLEPNLFGRDFGHPFLDLGKVLPDL